MKNYFVPSDNFSLQYRYIRFIMITSFLLGWFFSLFLQLYVLTFCDSYFLNCRVLKISMWIKAQTIFSWVNLSLRIIRECICSKVSKNIYHLIVLVISVTQKFWELPYWIKIYFNCPFNSILETSISWAIHQSIWLLKKTKWFSACWVKEKRVYRLRLSNFYFQPQLGHLNGKSKLLEWFVS